ncbi:MAG TPA: cell division protein SepF [Lachnospiraceae bacterium]|nr:cell division protein SepF [Lachnospiraceae bacterium]
MSFLDRFLNAVRLNDDYDDDDAFYDDDDDFEDDEEFEEEEPPKQKNRFFKKMKKDEDTDYEEEDIPVRSTKKTTRTTSPARTSQRSKVTPMRRTASSRTANDMEVSVIKPVTMENTREIADTLLADSTVVLNLEGVDVELAQRIIDFACGTCYAIDGSLQKISNYIFILTPSSVEISGDITDVLNGGIPSMRAEY